jgi:exonuclease III
MIGVLFWNTNRNNVDDLLASIVESEDIDLVILAEYSLDSKALTNKLSLRNKDFQVVPTIGCNRINIVCNSLGEFECFTETSYYTISRYTISGMPLIIAAVHFPSQLRYNHDSREELARSLKQDIERAERITGISKTIALGDFNVNPFDKTMINANCMHALPCARLLNRASRVVNGMEYSKFYNPMWNFFGDYTSPPGTYYYSDSNLTCYFWNMFDQVIVRRSLRNSIRSLKIVTSTNEIDLLSDNETPNRDISDHLPICFHIKEEFA